MQNRRIDYKNKVLYVLLVLCMWAWTGCNITKSVPDGKYLLRSNTVKLKSSRSITKRGEIKENLTSLVIQKPNTYAWYSFNLLPVKLILYNLNPKKYEKDTVNFQLKSHTVERPVIFDSSQVRKTAQNMKSYLFNQGYFYARVKDTVKLKNKKAYVTYIVNTGENYLINKVDFKTGIDDSLIMQYVYDSRDETNLQQGKEFTFSLFQDERSRIASVLRDNGYYKFSQENISFEMDTANKEYFRNADNPFESAINFIALQKTKKHPTCDIKIIIRREEEPDAYKRYTIGKVEVYPDFKSYHDIHDSTMIEKEDEGVLFKYHDYYVRENVVLKHIFLHPGQYYSQADYDKTITKLNDLGIFQYIRIIFREDTANKNELTCRIEMNRNPKHSLGTNFEVSNGSTYAFGTAVTETFRDINLAKGANTLTITANGGVEMPYYPDVGKSFFQHFVVLTKYYGVNANIDFPKFLSPIGSDKFVNSNLPHTIIGVGANLLDRVNYFTLINETMNFTYDWRETQSKTWDFSPAFINIIRLPQESDSFRTRLLENDFLRNSYKQNFIEGENLTYTYSDQIKKLGRNYSFLKLGVEEAGGLLSGINNAIFAIGDLYPIKYAQYTKFDFDVRHYFSLRHSTVALRFDGGIGVPYGQSDALPYIKQYYVGGPYSLRGWRIRSLGPGSSVDTNINSDVNFIDRTGDIKLEFNGEFRFDIVQLFAGFIKMNGAIFTDAGNIWLYKADPNYPGGEFRLSTFGQDIAADIGAGARFDIATFVTLRLDVGFPIKKPYVPANGGWVFKDIAVGDPTWRSDNLIFSVAIGYPF